MEIDFGFTSPIDLDFHPSQQLFSVGTLDGDLFLYGYAAYSEPRRLFQVRAHRRLIGAVRFFDEGRAIVTGTFEGSILVSDVETGSAIARLEKFRQSQPVSRVVSLTESTFASGHCDGCIKVWDIRRRACCSVFEVHGLPISSMTSSADAMKVLTTSDDLTLSVSDLRYKESVNKSSEEELLSVTIIKNGSTVVCGAVGGALYLHSWDFSEDCSKILLGLSVKYIKDLVVVDEDTVITGSEGGVLSMVGIMSGRSIQRIAQHSTHDIEHLSISHDKRFIGSTASLDNTLMIWDLDELS